jgi:hypothetical protein
MSIHPLYATSRDFHDYDLFDEVHNHTTAIPSSLFRKLELLTRTQKYKYELENNKKGKPKR